jgi:hypothetical protein
MSRKRRTKPFTGGAFFKERMRGDEKPASSFPASVAETGAREQAVAWQDLAPFEAARGHLDHGLAAGGGAIRQGCRLRTIFSAKP